MSGLLDSYSIYAKMTVAELKELLKSRDLPVSGKKKDLVQYLVFMDYPELFQVGGLVYDKIPLHRAGEWLLDQWTAKEIFYIFYAAINRQEI